MIIIEGCWYVIIACVEELAHSLVVSTPKLLLFLEHSRLVLGNLFLILLDILIRSAQEPTYVLALLLELGDLPQRPHLIQSHRLYPFAQLYHPVAEVALLAVLEDLEELLEVLGLGQGVVHLQLIAPVLGPHGEVLLLEDGLVVGHLDEPRVELLGLVEGQVNVLGVRDDLLELLNEEELLLDRGLRTVVVKVSVLEELLGVDKLATDLFVLGQEGIVLSRKCSFLPS